MLLSCLLFGALHLPNALYGQSVGATIRQFFFASFLGAVYYVLRRFTGTLIVPMVLHGAWDGSLFVNDFSGEDPPGLPSILFFIVIVVSLIALVQILREHPEAVQPAQRRVDSARLSVP